MAASKQVERQERAPNSPRRIPARIPAPSRHRQLSCGL